MIGCWMMFPSCTVRYDVLPIYTHIYVLDAVVSASTISTILVASPTTSGSLSPNTTSNRASPLYFVTPVAASPFASRSQSGNTTLVAASPFASPSQSGNTTLVAASPFASPSESAYITVVAASPFASRNTSTNSTIIAASPVPISPAPGTVSRNPAITVGTTTNHTRKRYIVIGAMSGAALVVAVLFGLLVLAYKRKSQPASLESDDIETVESLKFDFKKIRSATSNFAEDKKLGEGGFGEVFKGKLENGQEVAVKRLSKGSKQGITEFKNEVLLVAKLQHKNLVKLLGFCLERKEKLLVYEFLPNSSLDRILFDPSRRSALDWKTRFKIICGVARGLLYLHEDSRLKIIHRDLKSSNVLLDKDMNPKISDFGMAMLFGSDETQRKTNRIAGTFGYMAPEYIVTGHYSVKSDVYSFGIMILEIISSHRNNFNRSQQDEESLLHSAWRLWNEGHIMELMDSTLVDKFPREKAEKCIHIGLLCIQEDAARRPTMASVVAALSNDSVTLPPPRPPHFFGLDELNGDQGDLVQVAPKFTGSENITELEPR